MEVNENTLNKQKKMTEWIKLKLKKNKRKKIRKNKMRKKWWLVVWLIGFMA